MLYESGPSFEYITANLGHYPEARNKKGIEPEGLATGTFGEDKLIFVGSERGSLVGVYKDTGAEPQFIQVLPSGIGPEGLIAIPSRNLFVTANETDLVEDGLARSHVMIYERAEGPATYPMITASLTDEGTPLGWGALSALAAGDEAGKLYAASDSVYSGAALDLHDRRHADPGADHQASSSSPATAIRPRSSTSKASSPTAKAASGSPTKAIRRSSSRTRSSTSTTRARSRRRSASRSSCSPARPASASKASPPSAKATT